jgi:hypothetical protein
VSGLVVVDLVAMAASALEDVDRRRPLDAHIVHRSRVTRATHALVDRDPGVYFNQIQEAVEVAAGPCPCDRCRSPLPTIDPSTPCTQCGRPWSEHWGFNCDEPYADRKFRPLLAGRYPSNRAPWTDEE